MRSMFMAGIGVCAVLMSNVSAAQINPTLTEVERGIRDDNDDTTRYLRIEELTVDVHVIGGTASIAVEALIGAENSDSDYEANLSLLLPKNAIVDGYALDIDGRLIPGQLLERPRARELYEDEVRAGIDPGLGELAAQNRFTTRIFPVSREHARRFRLRFAAPFDADGSIILPLTRAEAIRDVRVNVSIDGYREPPRIYFAGQQVGLAAVSGSWRASLNSKHVVLGDGLSIRGGVLSNSLIVTRHQNGDETFLISDRVVSIAANASRGGRLRIYWDRSLSHRDGYPEREVETLLRLVDLTTPQAIDLVTFASDTPAVTAVYDTAGLRAALDAITYRGATSLAGLDSLALASAQQCVMVFDGQITIDSAANFVPGCRLSVITASSDADGSRLGRIAQRSGGIVVHLAEGQVVSAADALARASVGVVSVRDQSGRSLSYRALPAANGSWLLVGVMPNAGAIRVRLSDGSERRYRSKHSAIRGDAPGVLWAATRVSELGDDPTRHDAMVAFARRFRIASTATSFLVLEQPSQYLRAHLDPPSGYSEEWMEEFRAAQIEQVQSERDEKERRFAFVLEQWQSRKTWWNRRFVARGGKMHESPERRPAPIGNNRSPSFGGTFDPDAPHLEESIITGSRRESLVPIAPGRAADTDRKIGVDLAKLLADRPYIAALDSAQPTAWSKVLGEQERAYGSVPTFYLDVAEWFRQKGDASTALQLLLSALELPTTDDETRQIVAFRLERDKVYDRAVELAEQLAAANAEFRPQPKRDLALALAARGRSRGQAGRADLERAFKLLIEVALNPASSDFDGIEVVALMEANALIPQIEAVGGHWSLDKRLVSLLDTDVRIVIGWTADDADIDLWVDEPNGERVYYGASLSRAGGQISNDMTDGYGPEEYTIHRAPAGDYQVRVNGYDADRINPNGPGHVLIRLVRNFARKSEQLLLVDTDLAFQRGANRDNDTESKPIATLHVGK